MELVHCKTQEQADKLLKYWGRLGREWNAGNEAQYFTYWEVWDASTVYSYQYIGDGISYSSIRFFKKQGHTPTSFEEYAKAHNL